MPFIVNENSQSLTEAAKVSEEWDEFLRERYKDPSGFSGKTKTEFRDYETATKAKPGVEEFYKKNHENQTLEFVLAQKAKYSKLERVHMSVWEALEKLNALVDESDPDTSLTQIEHSLQTAESARRANAPRWLILTALIHDLGKVLFLWGEPQWAVVGDTFPVGCAYSPQVVYAPYFASNPDARNPMLSTECGIYERHCGLDAVHMSFGHDEYLYHVMKPYLPVEALYVIRYHSFYAAHKEGQYEHLMDGKDRELMGWIRRFNPFDLYSKSDEPPSIEELRPFYEELIAEYFPGKIWW